MTVTAVILSLARPHEPSLFLTSFRRHLPPSIPGAHGSHHRPLLLLQHAGRLPPQDLSTGRPLSPQHTQAPTRLTLHTPPRSLFSHHPVTAFLCLTPFLHPVSILPCNDYTNGWQTLSVKGQTRKTFAFTEHMVRGKYSRLLCVV